MKKIITGIIMGIWVIVATVSQASSEINVDESKNIQNIRIEEKKLEVDFRSTKQFYDVNERIVFRVTPNKACYLYLFNMNEGDNKALQLFPSKFEGMNKVKANKEVTIPSKSNFKSGKPGVERLVLIASTRKLNLKTTKIGDGKFFQVTKSDVKGITKNIRIEPKQQIQQAVSELDIIIKGENSSSTPLSTITVDNGSTKPVVLISTDKPNYQLNERMTIAYAVDADGILELYYVNPRKKVELLKKARVEKDKIYRLKARTGKPSGGHVLVGVFREKGGEAKNFDPFVNKVLKKGGDTKDIQLIEEPRAYSVYSFNIE